MKDLMIKQYIRNKKGTPIGVLVAVRESKNVVSLGWALCHKHDQFSKAKGTMIARNRAESDKEIHIPETLEKAYAKFADRAQRYYFPEVTEEV